MDHFGKVLKSWREYRQLTQVEFSELLGITQPLVSQYETNNIPCPSGSTIKRFCLVLHINYEMLMDGHMPPFIHQTYQERLGYDEYLEKLKQVVGG